MNGVLTELRKGIIHGIGFLIPLMSIGVVTGLVAQAVNSFSSGDTISAAQMNENFTSLQTIITNNHNIAAPEGAIVAFYLATCPAGWVAADGTNSTPDLRGYFVRGRDPGNVTGRDPDGSRAIGHAQVDTFASHSHSVNGSRLGNATWDWFGQAFSGSGAVPPLSTNAAGSTETRPENVALTYCMRKDT